MDLPGEVTCVLGTGMVIDLGGGRVTTELPTYEVADLPSAGESIEIDLRESSFTGLDQNIFNQDEADRTIGIFRVNGSWFAPDGLQITFVDENGDPDPDAYAQWLARDRQQQFRDVFVRREFRRVQLVYTFGSRQFCLEADRPDRR